MTLPNNSDGPPNDIPQDVWKTAQDAAAMYVEWLVPMPTEYDQSEHVLAVSFARAILAERERCAAACDPFDKPVSTSNFVNGQSTAAQQIRGTIRKGGEA